MNLSGKYHEFELPKMGLFLGSVHCLGLGSPKYESNTKMKLNLTN